MMQPIELGALITFAIDGPGEHANILASILRSNASEHEIGARLNYFRERKLWTQVEATPALTDFVDYLNRAVKLPVTTAYRYMDAAFFPQWCSAQFGVEKMAELRKIVALTAADESPEEAVALVLPQGDGQSKPFTEATADQVRRARKVIKEGKETVRRELTPGQAAAVEAARAVEAQIEEAAKEWLTPQQVVARRRGTEVFVDFHGVKASEAQKLFAALAAALPKQ